MKKMLLVALAAMSALLALPAFASATPAHLDQVAEFEAHGGASTLSRTDGNFTTGTTTTGYGEFENTTTGWVELTFHGVRAAGIFSCNSAGQPAGTVTTTELPFHLVMLGTDEPGILVTSGENAKGEPHIASYSCPFAGVNIVVRGSALGEITSPACEGSSVTADLDFNGSEGVQSPLEDGTENEYTLESSLNGGAWTQSAMNAEAKITFAGGARKLICTH